VIEVVEVRDGARSYPDAVDLVGKPSGDVRGQVGEPVDGADQGGEGAGLPSSH
jgi:hypothetical protein